MTVVKLFDVQRDVVWGEYNVEFRYPNKGNFLLGRWSKYSSSAFNVPSYMENFNCSSCVDDTEQRIRNWMQVEIPHKTPFKSSGRTYRVLGITKKSDYYEWPYGRCTNPECWGPDAEYTFDVWRRQLPKDPSLTKYKFSTRKYFNGQEMFADHIFINMRRSEDEWTKYFGIGMKSNIRQFFWPGFMSGVHPSKLLYIYCELNSSLPVPVWMKKKPIQSWGYNYERSYIYPTRADIFMYEADPGWSWASKDDLDDFHKPLNRTYLDIYPGASGLRVSQFIYQSNTEDTPEWKLTQEEKAKILYAEGERRHIFWRSHPFKQLHAHLERSEVYEPGYQDGYYGPMISYYTRYDTNNSWFSV